MFNDKKTAFIVKTVNFFSKLLSAYTSNTVAHFRVPFWLSHVLVYLFIILVMS